MKKTYTVTVERGKKWWVLHCPEVRLVSQCRSLDAVEREMRPILAEIAEVDEADIELDIRYILPDDFTAHLASARRLREQASKAEREATAETRNAIHALLAHGITMRDTGRLMGITHQRISQLAKA